MPTLAAPLRTLGVVVLPGALVYATLFVLSVTLHASAEYMGVEDSSVTDRVLALFESQIIAQQLELLGLHLAIGATLSTLATLLIALVRRLFSMSPLTRRRSLHAASSRSSPSLNTSPS